MSPLEIKILLQLHAFAHPFEGYTQEQRYAPAMRDAFRMFRREELIMPELDVGSDFEGLQRLTLKGEDLVRRLCEVQP